MSRLIDEHGACLNLIAEVEVDTIITRSVGASEGEQRKVPLLDSSNVG